MRRKVILFVVAIVLVSLLAFFFVFKPQTENINKTRDDATATENRADQLELRLAQLQALQKDAPRLKQEAAILDAAVPNDPQLALFISQVQDQADSSGVQWVSVTFALPAPSSQPGVLEVNIAMNVSGGYFQVQDYLVRLETLARALKIGSLGLTTSTAATSTAASPDLNAILAMKMFVATIVVPPPALAPPLLSPTPGSTPTSTATSTAT
ncbi:MAG: type 4a pilus biogenesis protein PilO [Actinomycetota bacterium]